MLSFNIKSIFINYKKFINLDVDTHSKIFNYSNLLETLKKYKKICSIIPVGFSVEKRKIFKIKWGIGRKKIFIWSQMHGDETTGTKSIFDILNFFLINNNHEIVKFFFKNITISFIPMLNPDGSEYFKRRNSINIDLNRDFIRLESPEIKILFNEINKENPHILFNLHDQKSIYNVGNKSFNPAILSFLSPSTNKKENYNTVKMKSMGMIYEISKEIKKILPNNASIGRYSDKHYPNATGDCLQKMGYSCILIEAGNYSGDDKKYIIRKYNTISIIFGFYLLSSNYKLEKNYKNYFFIKKNKNILLDKIYRNIQIKKNNSIYHVDIGLMNFDKFNVKTGIVESEMKIVDIGDLSTFFAYKDIIASEKKLFVKKEVNNHGYPEIGDKEKNYNFL
ncbi:M14 family zinc carboxypeptidase [Blattabacterium cuenoti]|uniref:M14 family zinc carboxypeptidase n=1 Tax=Blattabacterium cuenoti TaxID=1653831 RepID=UPI00163CC249|nr:M14 family zinc carboxypeptidase [Blattabacterium cuenoti]